MKQKPLPENKEISRLGIIRILKTFTVSEFNEFDKFIRSPYFNSVSALPLILAELRKFHPDFSSRQLTAGRIFSAAGSRKKYEDVTFRKYMSRLYLLALDFFNVKEAMGNRNKRSINTLEQIVSRNIPEIYERFLKKIDVETIQNGDPDYEDYLARHLLSQSMYNYGSTYDRTGWGNEGRLLSTDYLSLYFLFTAAVTLNQIEVDKLVSRQDHTGSITQALFEKFDIREFIVHLLKHRSYRHESERIFLELTLNDILLSTEEQGHKAFSHIRTYLDERADYCSHSMKYYLINRLIVFCLLQKLKGNYAYERDLFELYKQMLDFNKHIQSGFPFMNLRDFRSILNSAISNNDFAWAEDFLKNYAVCIQEDSRVNTLAYGRAIIAFALKEFTESLNLLSTIRQESYTMILDVYLLKAQNLYELSYLDSALSAVDSFRHHLSSSKTYSVALKNAHGNFIAILRRLVSARKRPSALKIEKLIRELDSRNDIAKLLWLRKKAQEIKESYNQK